MNVSTSRCYVFSPGIEAVDTVTGIGSQRDGELAVAATDVNHQTTLDSAFGEYVLDKRSARVRITIRGENAPGADSAEDAGKIIFMSRT